MRLINPRIRWSACLMAAMTVIAIAPSAWAQHQQLAPREIAQISDEVLRVVAPPERSLGGVPVASRQLLFDVKRTLTAFGAPAASDTAMRLKRHVTPASQSVLSDCSQMDKKPCAGLGWRTYVWIRPLFVTAAGAVVRANVSWVARGTPFVPGSAAVGKGYLEGFSTKLHLVRDANGKWTVDKELETIAG